MALITQIRKRSGIVILLMVVALAGFILMDIVNNGSISGGGATSLGKVAGTTINAQEFQNRLQALAPNAGDGIYQEREKLWNHYVDNAILTKEAAEIGLGVGKSELSELQFGPNISQLMANFLQSRNMGMEELNQIKQMVTSGQQFNPEFNTAWKAITEQVQADRLKRKLSNLASKAVYAPKWLLDMSIADASTQVDFNYVKIAFDQIADKDITVSDADLKAYLDENKARFVTTEEKKRLSYISWNVVPSSADSADVLGRMTAVKTELDTTSADSTVFVANNGFNTNGYVEKDLIAREFSQATADLVATAPKGVAVGPFVDNNAYLVLQVNDTKSVFDSVRVRHILIKVDANRTDAAAKAKADSLLNLIVAANGANFAQIAAGNSEDPGSKDKGGEYTWHKDASLYPEYLDYCFNTGNVGEYKVIKTQQGGYHIMNIMGYKGGTATRYKFSFVREPIAPSETTTRRYQDEASKLLNEARDLASFEKKAKEKGLNVQTSAPVTASAYNLPGLGQGEPIRRILMWAFGSDGAVGKTAPEVYSFEDPRDRFVTQYAICAVKSTMKPGTPSVADLREEIEPLVKNKLKGEKIKTKIGNTTDLAALATQFNTKVDTARGVTFESPYVMNVGSEPVLQASVCAANANQTIKPVVGNTGVFVATVTTKSSNPQPVDANQMKMSYSSRVRNQVAGQLMLALRKKASITDSRQKYF